MLRRLRCELQVSWEHNVSEKHCAELVGCSLQRISIMTFQYFNRCSYSRLEGDVAQVLGALHAACSVLLPHIK